MKLPRLNLTVWILLGFILGILTGIVFGDLCSAMKPFSEAFIKIWQITILPSVAISLLVGIGSLKRDTVRSFAVKACLVILLMWIIGVAGFFAFQLAFPPREAGSFFSTQDLAAKTDINLIDQFIPSNLFFSLSDGIIPATVLFCLFMGFALMLNDGSGPILAILKILLRALERMTQIIAKTFPVGVFVITAVMAGTLTVEGFLDLQVFLVTLAAASVLLGLVVMPLLITCFTTFTCRDILAAASRAMILAFSTGTEFITLPQIADGVEKLFAGRAREPDNGITERSGGEDPGQRDVRSYSEILVPVAYTFPLLGGLVPFLFILFVAWMYKNPLDLVQQAELVLVGIPSFFGSSKLSVISLLSLMHLPADAYNLYISSGILRQCFVAPLSVIAIFAFSTITIAYTTGKAHFRWKRAIASLLFVLILAGLTIAGLHAGFTYLLAGTYHGGDQISRIELPLDPGGQRLDAIVNTTVYLHPEDVPPIVHQNGGDKIKEIRERDMLRVGYNRNNVPFVFFNGKGELVGYDVEMAYDLARSMNVSRIEFVPITGTTLADSLDSGYCDIVMSAVMVTTDRFETMTFSDPIVTVHLSFVVPDGKEAEFTQLDSVQGMDGVRIAVFNNTALVNGAKRLFPKATIVTIDSKEEFFLEGRADALLIPAEEGYTMTLVYPFFDVAIIEPHDSYKIMYAYPVSRNSSESYLLALNYWIAMERDYGQLEKKYNYWVLGEIPEATKPRWSVVRDVLHWVD
jgi:Na+/H+-dicarboxylate symporter/ABC-type amino acid transport substrate-binding protein